MSGDLGTTNLLLAIMVAISALEAIVIAALGISGVFAFRRVTRIVDAIETRHVAPAMARVHAILDDVQEVTSRVREETHRVDRAVHTTIDRIDEAATRLRSSVRATASPIIGIIRGLRVALTSLRAMRYP